MILALDLGTKTGFAYLDSAGMVQSGLQKLKGSRFEGGGMRFLRFSQWLDTLPKPTEVYYEAVRAHKGTDAAHIYGGLQATLTSWCELHEVPYDARPVQAIKKHATGRGNAGKPEMMAAFHKSVGRLPESDDEADAYWLLQLILHEKYGDIFE